MLNSDQLGVLLMVLVIPVKNDHCSHGKCQLYTAI